MVLKSILVFEKKAIRIINSDGFFNGLKMDYFFLGW